MKNVEFLFDPLTHSHSHTWWSSELTDHIFEVIDEKDNNSPCEITVKQLNHLADLVPMDLASLLQIMFS